MSEVDHPPHYTSHPSGVECVTITEHFNFNIGNAVKYLWRAGLKGDLVTDLEKAQWYVAREIERIQREQPKFAVNSFVRFREGSGGELALCRVVGWSGDPRRGYRYKLRTRFPDGTETAENDCKWVDETDLRQAIRKSFAIGSTVRYREGSAHFRIVATEPEDWIYTIQQITDGVGAFQKAWGHDLRQVPEPASAEQVPPDEGRKPKFAVGSTVQFRFTDDAQFCVESVDLDEPFCYTLFRVKNGRYDTPGVNVRQTSLESKLVAVEPDDAV